MSEPEWTLDASAELRAAQSVADALIFEAMSFAKLCDQFGRLSLDVELPPPSTFAALVGPHIELVRQDLASRAAAYALVTMVAACDTYAVKVRLIVELATKILRRPDRTIRFERLLRALRSADDRRQGTNARTEIREILRLLNAEEGDLPSICWLSQAASVRNVVVHNHGLVDATTAPNGGTLQTTWLRLGVTVDGEFYDGEVGWEAGASLGVGQKPIAREWPVGSKIVLSLQDCLDVGLSLVRFIQDLNNLVGNRLVMIAQGTIGDTTREASAPPFTFGEGEGVIPWTMSSPSSLGIEAGTPTPDETLRPT